MEDTFVIQGAVPLKGEVKLSGAKNVALKTIIAALLFNDKVILHNIPRIEDVVELMGLIREIGGEADFIGDNCVRISGKQIKSHTLDFLRSSKIRVSFMLFAPLLYKFGQAKVPNPGGCRIGARPIDRIIESMRSLGIHVTYDSSSGYYDARMVEVPQGSYTFLKASHTGTELLILLSVFTKSKVVIHNAALEPEIDDLISFLNSSGANIKKDGTSVTILPARVLKQKTPYRIICDRNEAVTYAVLGVATKGDITLSPIPKDSIDMFVHMMEKAGAGFEKKTADTCRFFYKSNLKPVSITTDPHPGFMTDWQPAWAILMTQAHGKAVIHERMFENRFSYVEELNKLGAHIRFIDVPVSNPYTFYQFNYEDGKTYSQAIQIHGPQKLHGGVLNIADLRAGATVAIAALIAQGESVVNGVSILERGYEQFVEKVRKLGGRITKK
ncbi:hypothetical protein COT62_00735 [Candidatus Roizmanbacteria bacterium CG09_land_8_20_14_0_10_41_9]|uniref:UDP-N-acetylglucosamine 1-carboxyvinyltransferase n=1 Tax=Candidatus Roizmanbacteria bacterium CG09_land_8_20_14_0_10_41_9 TaxID=1974850 RepID=A0A2H0WTJ3_9BACT|nr:MAG: hypothetical protein COT62_00735 [Candidatus Roizmanbacteria bacterium CG09_land_8_20_14_0_10_41_9]